jgi:hypothetical protein
MARARFTDGVVGQTIALALLCAAALAAVVLIGILPQARELRRCEGQIADLQCRLDEQAILAPAYAELQQQVRAAKPLTLPAPTRAPLKADKLAVVGTRFAGLAQECGIELVQAVPEAKSLEGGYQRILVQVLARGQVPQLRGFLLALIGTPFTEHVDRVGILRGTPAEEFRLQVWIDIE